MTEEFGGRQERAPQHHRTIDRMTQILEEVVYDPGMTFAELSRTIDAPKSSVYGFVQGLLATGWLHQDAKGFHLGPAIHGLTLASGHLRAGAVTDLDLHELHQATGFTVFMGVRAGDDLIYVSEVGANLLFDFAARKNIRRGLLNTAGGKILLAEASPSERDGYLRRRSRDELGLVEEFLTQYDEIKRTRIAHNTLHGGSRRAIAAAVFGPRNDQAAGEVTLVGSSEKMQPRTDELMRTLLEHVDSWRARATSQTDL